MYTQCNKSKCKLYYSHVYKMAKCQVLYPGYWVYISAFVILCIIQYFLNCMCIRHQCYGI